MKLILTLAARGDKCIACGGGKSQSNEGDLSENHCLIVIASVDAVPIPAV